MPHDAGDGNRLERIARLAASWFGVGHFPFGPGTLAALSIWPLHWLLSGQTRALEVFLVTAIAVLGFWAADRAALSLGQHDPPEIVIDEAAGAFLALAIASGHGLFGDFLALALFRLFDIYKPWPVIALERLENRGAAIMLDDLAAGALAGAFVSLI